MIDIAEAVNGIVNELEKLKIDNIDVYDVSENSPIADYFVVSTADSIIQLGAARTRINNFMHRNKIPLKNPNEKWEGGWLIMDFGDIIANVFLEEKRSFYAIDDLLKAEKFDFYELKDGFAK